MNNIIPQPDMDKGLDYIDPRNPNVKLHVQIPRLIDEPTKKRAHALADQLSREIFANISQYNSESLNVEITADQLILDPNDKYAAEGDSKEWMAAQCRIILSKMSLQATSAHKTKNSDASKEQILPTKTSEIYSNVLNELMMQVGHIHGDLFIKATQLEGYAQIKMMHLSLKILEKQLTSILKLPSDPTNTKTINELNTLITRITNGLKTQEPPDIAAKIANIQKALKDLKPTEGILLPGGWIGTPCGHAMCYEIIKQQDNNFTMRIINTGSGIDNHASMEILDLDAPGRQPKTLSKSFPYLEYIDIPAEKMISGGFWRAAMEIQMYAEVPSLDPDVHVPTDYSSKDLYTKLFPNLGGTQVIPSKTNPDKFILAQSSGTCSWSSMRAYMQTHLSPPAFARLEYECKMESLCQLHKALNSTEKLTSNEKGRLLLLKSSEHMANSLQENSEKHVITNEEYKNARTLLQQIQDNIAKSIIFLNDKLDKEAPRVDFSVSNNMFASNPNLKYAPIDLTVNKVHKKPCEVIFDRNWIPNALTIEKDLMYFQKLYSKNLESYPENVSVCIRELLLKLPKSSDEFWKEIPIKNFDSCVESISLLSETLIKGSQKTFHSPNDSIGATYLAGLYKSQLIIHELVKGIPELQTQGVKEWKLNVFYLGQLNQVHKFSQEVTDTIQDLLPYEDPFSDIDDQSFFSTLSEGTRANGNFSGVPKNDNQFVYRYYLGNKKKFEETLGPEFEKLIAGSKEAQSMDQNLAKATFAMTDLSGKFLPPAYRAMRRLKFQLLQFRTSFPLPEGPTVITCKLAENTLSLAPNKAIPIISKHKENDYTQHAILSKFPNKLNFNHRTDILSFCEEHPQFKQIFQICEALPIIDAKQPYELQIIKLLDYFKVHIEDLNNHDLQCFFKQVLYQENDLKTLLLSNPELANSLATFVQNGYSILKERKNISGAAFMIYLAQMLQETLWLFPKPSKDIISAIKRLSGVDTSKVGTNKESLIDLLKDCKTLSEKSLVHQQLLYQYSLDLNPKIASEILPDIIASMAFLRSFPVPKNHITSHIQDKIDRLRIVDFPLYLEQFKKDPQLLTKSAQKAFQFLGIKDTHEIDLKDTTWVETPPIYEAWKGTPPALVASLDLSNFTFLAAGEGIGPLPSTILNNPSFLKALPPMEQQIVKIKQLNLYEFADDKGLRVRIKALKDNMIIIQREFLKNTWYEYQSTDTIEPFTHSSTLTYEKTYWACCDANQVLLCKPNTFECTHRIELHPTDNKFIQTVDLAGLRLLYPGDDQPYKGMKHVENTAFTHVWVNPQNNMPSRIELPRLKLTFNVPADLSTTHATCAEITGYRIAEKQYVPFLGTFKNYLVLENEKGEIKVIIPRKKAVITEKGGLTSQLSLLDDFPEDTASTKFPPYYEYAINAKSGALEATKEGGNLFLSYILTGQRRYKEAQTYLREKSAKLKKYSEREEEILSWINNLSRSTQDNDPKACIAFLTAIALFAKNQIQGKNYDFLSILTYIKYPYRFYLSNMHHLGDLLLSPAEELAILKLLIKHSNDPVINHRYNLLSSDPKIELGQTSDPPAVMNQHNAGGDEAITYQKIYKDVKFQIDHSEQTKFEPIKKEQEITPALVTRPNLNFSHEENNNEKVVPFDFKANYKAAKATKPGENLNAAMHFKLLNAFQPDASKIFLAAVALEPDKFFYSWDELVRLFIEPDNKISGDSRLEAMFKQAKQIYLANFPTAKTINEPDQKIKIEASQKSIEAKAKIAIFQPQNEISEILVVSNTFNTEEVTAKRIKLSQQIANKLFVASQMDAKELKSNSDQLIKELSQNVMGSTDPTTSTALFEAAKKHLSTDIRIYSAQPAKPIYHFKDKTFKTILKTAIESNNVLSAARNELNQETVKLQNQMLGILNKSTFSETPSVAQLEVTSKYHAELLSGQKRSLTIDDLSFAILRKNPGELSSNNPHLSKDDIEALSLMLNSYLITMSEENTLKRQEETLLETVAFMKTMPDIPNAIDSPELNERIDKAAKELSTQRAYKPNDPKINSLPFLIFEAATGLSLRPDQIDNITGLIKADNQIRQMIMGSGKSKILLPLLALTRADGQNLSLIIIPPQLFEDTVQDLRGSLGTAFGKSLRTLPFERDTEFTVSKLKDIHDHLIEIIRNRECLMMTPKSAACLGLKLNEALDLFATHPDTPDLREKIEMLQKILNIFKNQGKAILDEVDMILNPRLEVNFTAGVPVALTKERCETVGLIYRQLVKPEFSMQIGFNPLEGFNLSTDAYQKHIKPALLKNIIEDAENDAKNTFGIHLKTLSKTDKATIIHYLEGLDSPSIEAMIEKSPMRDTLALLKEELNTLLPLTLSKQYCVHYGLTQKKTKANQPISSLAIPYKGNNAPDEASQFQSPDILMNYTMQTLLKTGIAANDINRVVVNLRNQASHEMALKGSRDPLSTIAYKEFQELCGKELSHIKFLSTEDSELELIAKKLNNTRSTAPNIFLNYVSTYVFPQIKSHPRQMTSNAINLVSMFKSVNGFTGTPWNSITYHKAIAGKNVVTVAGTDGKTAMLLNNQIQAAKDGIREVTTTVFPEIISDLIRKDDDAIIDTGALFAGHSHENVALGIFNVLQSRGSAKRGVIFYKKNKAMVLEKTDTPNKPRLVPLRACTLKPEELFTYYDQSHTTGADISQQLMAKATLTIGKNVTERDLAQGAWRMRGLDKQQTVSLALSPEVSKLIGFQYMLKSPKEITFAHILNFVSQNQVEELSPQLMTSIRNKFNDIVFQPVLNILLNTKFVSPLQKGTGNMLPVYQASEEAAKKLIKEIRHILVSNFNNSPYTLYGKQEKPLPTLQTLEKMRNTALKKLESVPAESQLFGSTNKKAFVEKITHQMDALIKETIGLLPTLSKGASANETTSQNEQETETETALHNQSNVNKDSSEVNLKPWWPSPDDSHLRSSKETEESNVKAAPALLSATTYASQKFSSISTGVKIFNVGARLNEHNSASRFSSLFGVGLDITENADRSEGKQLEGSTQYTLYVREKSTGHMKLIFLDSKQDVSFFWVALDKERSNKYPIKGQPEVDICLCSLDGDIIQHSKGVDPSNLAGDPFMKDLQIIGTALRAQAKLSKGEFFYTSDELIEIQKIIKQHGAELVLDYFKEFILPRSSNEKQRSFKTSQIYRFLTR